MKDIARELGVSVVTVSKALTGKDGVSDSVRQKIKNVADEIGYVLPSTAKSNKNPTHHKVGILTFKDFVSDASGEMQPNYFYWSIHSQLSLCLSSVNCTNFLEVATEEMERNGTFPSMVQNGDLDGLIILGALSESYIAGLEGLKIPLLLVDFYTGSGRYPSVTADNYYNAYFITNRLIAEGHRDIGFVGSLHNSTSSIPDRYFGMCRAMLENNLPVREEWVIPDRVDRTRTISLKFPDKLPTAFVCNNDRIARLTIETLQAAGYAVPDDVSVVGFDDSIYARVSKPYITTMALDVEALADRAVKSIVSAIEQPEAKRESYTVRSKLLLRDSHRTIV